MLVPKKYIPSCFRAFQSSDKHCRPIYIYIFIFSQFINEKPNFSTFGNTVNKETCLQWLGSTD